MRKKLCINVSGLGWTGSSLLIEIFKNTGYGIYHAELNLLRHPRLDEETHTVSTKDKISVLFSEILSCMYNIRQDFAIEMKLKILLEIFILITLIIFSFFINIRDLKKIYLNCIFKIYSKRKILILDQMYFPEDLTCSAISGSLPVKHIYILRRNVVKVLDDRRNSHAALFAKTVQEKFLIGKNLDISAKLIYGDIARDLMHEREAILQKLEINGDICTIYFEDIIEDTEYTLCELEKYIVF